jgi:hypothetical protein
MIINDEFMKMGMKVVMPYVKALFQRLFAVLNKIAKRFPGQPVFWLDSSPVCVKFRAGV